MATPAASSVWVPRGTVSVRTGGGDALAFALQSTGSFPPNAGAAGSQKTIVNLHASSAGTTPFMTTAGHRYFATGSGNFSNARVPGIYIGASTPADSVTGISFNPQTTLLNGSLPIAEYLHTGHSATVGGTFDAIHVRQYRNAIIRLLNMYPQASRDCITWYGESMGSWAVLQQGLRSPDLCSLISSSRPRPRQAYDGALLYAMPAWSASSTTYAAGSAPAFSAADGGISATSYYDIVAFINASSGWLPAIQMCTGRNDTFNYFPDYVDLCTALEAKGVRYEFAWNNGDHSVGHIIGQMGRDHWGDFSISRGSPLFRNYSRNSDPAVDLVGHRYVGLRFRNVVESASAWSCEVTRIATTFDSSTAGATVDVLPYSRVFTASVAAQTVTIPAAGTWVSVTFNA